MTPGIINDALNKLKSKNSSGPDKISTLKSIIPIIMGPICHLFDLSFKTGFIPTTLKTAKIVPIFKASKFAFFILKTSRKSGRKSNHEIFE